MGKYEDAKFLVIRKARKEWTCFRCGKRISIGQYYYRESLGLIDKGPNITLQAYCKDCGSLPDEVRLG